MQYRNNFSNKTLFFSFQNIILTDLSNLKISENQIINLINNLTDGKSFLKLYYNIYSINFLEFDLFLEKKRQNIDIQQLSRTFDNDLNLTKQEV